MRVQPLALGSRAVACERLRNPERSRRRLVDICEDSLDVWRKLPQIDWGESLRKHKTHLEFHSHLPLLIGNSRPTNSDLTLTSISMISISFL